MQVRTDKRVIIDQPERLESLKDANNGSGFMKERKKKRSKDVKNISQREKGRERERERVEMWKQVKRDKK